jgi:hypothetical protein
MTDYFYNKIDFIIMVILALLVAFIIGFNIIQIVDSKLSSVTINVPPQNCQLPPIYLSVDKENNNFKQIKFNDVVSVESNKSMYSLNNNLDNIENYKENINENINENFGNLQDYQEEYEDNQKKLISDINNLDTGINIINSKSQMDLETDDNYNTVNNIPLLFSPDTDVPNRAGPDSKGYYASKVQLVNNINSPLMKLEKLNSDKINSVLVKSIINDSKKIPKINGIFDGYNAFNNLQSDSYANITSIGKSMLTPYISFPVPS